MAPVAGGVDSLADALAELRRRGVAVRDIGLRRPTLDDVFLQLTGHAAEGSEGPAVEPAVEEVSA